MLINDKRDGILIPIPQYPLYSALITAFGGSALPYYLDEENNWALDIDNLKLAIKKAKSKDKRIRAIVVINPGNPTGQVLTKQNI